MPTDDGGGAFPWITPPVHSYRVVHPGMSVRQYYKAKVTPEIYRKWIGRRVGEVMYDHDIIARAAGMMADAMIREDERAREETDGTQERPSYGHATGQH